MSAALANTFLYVSLTISVWLGGTLFSKAIEHHLILAKQIATAMDFTS